MSAQTGSISSKLQSITDGNCDAYSVIKKAVGRLRRDSGDLNSFESYVYASRGEEKSEVVYRVRESYEHMKNFEASNRELINKINIGTAEEPQEPGSLTYQPNLMEEAKMFEKMGVGFGEDETYRIFKSLAVLSVKKSTRQLRLWGKMLGTNKDYYIAEGLADNADQGELGPETEPKGTGINKFNYWATNSLTDQWTELPTITPDQLQTSRKIRYLFTGSLNQEILTNPKYNGTQAHLLKCQIVRINTTCSIVPKGVWVINPDDPKDIMAPQEYVYPPITDLNRKESWVYMHPSVLKNGRISHLKPEQLDPEQEQAWAKEQQVKDPVQPRLKNIVLDSQNWVLKSVELNQRYKTKSRSQTVVSKGVIGLKNLLWPGWTTLAYEGTHSNLYIGYGHKSKQIYFPKWPETVLSECADREEAVVDQ